MAGLVFRGQYFVDLEAQIPWIPWQAHYFDGLEVQISWQARRFVNLEVKISWQAQPFVNLEVQILWQAQHFANLEAQISWQVQRAIVNLEAPWQAQHFVLSDAHSLSLSLSLSCTFLKTICLHMRMFVSYIFDTKIEPTTLLPFSNANLTKF